MCAQARARDAGAVRHAEQRAMGGAEEMLAVRRDETIGHPVERRALMRAGIQKGPRPVALPMDENLVLESVDEESLGLAVGNLLQPAEPAGLRHLSPPMREISFQAGSSTGITDRRE